MRSPGSTKLAIESCDDDVAYHHGDSSPYGKRSSTHLVQIEASNADTRKLRYVDDTSKNTGHVVGLTKLSEEGGRVIDESVYTNELSNGDETKPLIPFLL